ncbi:unnamed protein product [Calypogeia fissa]
MVKAVRVHSLSGKHTVQYEDIRVPPPPESHVEIRHTAIVASSCDQLAKEGQLPGYSLDWSSLKYPFTLGLSGVGVITEVGSGLLDYQIGQRVFYVSADEPGSFSEQRVICAKQLVPVPEFLTDEQTASIIFEGLEAWMLLRRVFPVRKGDTVLIHEITSGLGSLLGQWAKFLGAIVIGTVATKDEISKAEKSGFDNVFLYRNFQENVLKVTNGKGVAAVYSIGGYPITGSFDCIAPNGMLVITGGPNNTEVGEIESSFSVACPILQDFIGKREDLLAATTELFSLIKLNTLSVPVKDKYPLQKAGQALNDLARQEVFGSVILTPPVPDPKDIPHGS